MEDAAGCANTLMYNNIYRTVTGIDKEAHWQVWTGVKETINLYSYSTVCCPAMLHGAAADAARHAGPGSPWSKLHKYVVRAVDSSSKGAKKKGQAAMQQQQQPAAAAQAASAPSTSAAAVQQPQPPAAAAAGGSGTGGNSRSSSSRRGQLCWSCGAGSGSGVSLSKCSSCSKAVYCSRSCQEDHWKQHRADCKKWKKEKEGAGQ